MKKIYLLLTVLLFQYLGFTQTDTTYQKTTAEEGIIEKQHLVAIKDCFLCKYGDVRRAFRLGYGNMTAVHQALVDFSSGVSYLPSYFLEYEQKIATGFSINTQFKHTSLPRRISQIETIAIEGASIYEYESTHFKNNIISIEPRWYFHKKKQINNGRSGDNLNGVYLGLLLSQNWWKNGNYKIYKEPDFSNARSQRETIVNKGQNQIALLNFGWQQSFRNRNFFIFQLGTGISRNTQNIRTLNARDGQIIEIPSLSKWKWLLNYQIGWMGTIGKKNQIESEPNHFIEYYEENDAMWKIDVYNIFQGLNEKGAIGRLHISYEQKIKHSPFSLEGGIQYLYSHHFETKKYIDQFALQIEPRFYYHLKKDIRSGNGANNLSSTYLGLLTQWNIGGADLSPIRRSFQNNLIWGFQERILKSFFIDYRVGLGLNSMVSNEEEDNLFQEFRLGFAF